MDGRVRVGVVTLVLGLTVGLSLPSTAQPAEPDDRPVRTISVSGTAVIRSGPDEAVVSLGVEAEAPTAEAALRDNAAKMQKVFAVLADMGFGEDRIATAWFNLYPNHDGTGRTIVSYTATNQLDVTVRDMSKLGPVIDRSVRAGANLAGGIQFRVSDQNEGRDGALRAAVEDARGKAELLAAAAGAQLGPVVTIQEMSSDFPPPVFMDRAVAAEAAGTPIEPPTIESRVSVQVVWELG